MVKPDDPILNASYPTPGLGLTLDVNGKIAPSLLFGYPTDASKVLAGDGSWPNPSGYEYAYSAFTGNVSVTATTEATANTVVTASAVTFDGATTVIVEFFAEQVIPGTNQTLLYLYDGAASIGFWSVHKAQTPASLRRRLTPSAAAHTYSVRGSVDAGTGTVTAGAGGAGANMPGYIRVTKS